ncbi:hypothetical protein CDD81_1294 [Ophiocordyceps australis]|uniref:Enoyl reductase (ER) domain-containing protein n=1 Tax=Ophiocordyceps australis TaxID=1399860 RepID=A0A2C5XZB0_9HYPO|nr:hypothetical protein CDD81_1294 [Ophiocordyceps australis]
MSLQVKASVLHGARDLRIQQRTLPPPEADQVQVSVQATGLCGSDLHYFTHYRNGDILVREPLTLGHESAGTVVAVGSGAAHLYSPGDGVALEVGLPCEACEFCAQGRYNICRGMRFCSSAKAVPHMQGTLQERINHPARWCHKLPSNVSLALGALAEPLAVAMHAHGRAHLAPGSSAAVLGAGAVGLLVAAVCKAKDLGPVVIADIQKDRVDFAVENGFADVGVVVPLVRPQTLDEKLEYARRVADLVKEARVNGKAVGEVAGVFECTGVESCVQSAIYASKPGGRVMLIGMGTPILTLPMSAAALREIDLVGVFRYANVYPQALELLAHPPANMPDLSRIITHRFKGMDSIADAFSMAAKVKDDENQLVLKVLVETEPATL